MSGDGGGVPVTVRQAVECEGGVIRQVLMDLFACKAAGIAGF